MRYKGRQRCQDFPLSFEKKQSDFLVAVTAGGCSPVMRYRRDRDTLVYDAVQCAKPADVRWASFGVFFNKTKILTEYYENSFNANIDCSTYLTSKEKARKLESTTRLNLEQNNPSFHNGAVHEKVFK